MQVSHETIYRSLFVQSGGDLRHELTRQLRTRRAMRRLPVPGCPMVAACGRLLSTSPNAQRRLPTERCRGTGKEIWCSAAACLRWQRSSSEQPGS